MCRLNNIIITSCLQVLVGHDDIISCVAITDNNQSVVSGSRDNGLLVWNLSTGTVEQELLGHSDQVTTVKVSKDGSIAISGMGVFLDHGVQILLCIEKLEQVNNNFLRIPNN